MGEYKTQQRTLRKNPKFLRGYNNDPLEFWGEMFPQLNSTQMTESYRTSGVRVTGGTDAEFLAEAKEFSDVTRNGLTEISDSQWDTGHPFYTTKTSVRLSHPRWRYDVWAHDGTKVKVRMPLVPLNNAYNPLDSQGKFPAAPRLTGPEISNFGAKAIGEAAPTNPHASLATFVGELREGLPSLIGLATIRDRAHLARSAGSEYLNVEFGWKPLISDVKKFATVAARSSQMLQQFQRDSGRLVRRSYHFPTVVSGTDPTPVQMSNGRRIAGIDPVGEDWFLQPRTNWFPEVLFSSNKRESVYFKGAFMYHLEADDSVLGKLQRFEQLSNHLLGSRLTPETLWELSPWSWLIDWLGTFGDFLHTSSLLSNDGLVMKYGYLMRHTVEFNQYSIPAGITFNGGAKTGPITSTFYRETKERVKATPFGFGLSVKDFSPKQWAILGALGLTKAPGILP